MTNKTVPTLHSVSAQSMQPKSLEHYGKVCPRVTKSIQTKTNLRFTLGLLSGSRLLSIEQLAMEYSANRVPFPNPLRRNPTINEYGMERERQLQNAGSCHTKLSRDEQQVFASKLSAPAARLRVLCSPLVSQFGRHCRKSKLPRPVQCA